MTDQEHIKILVLDDDKLTHLFLARSLRSRPEIELTACYDAAEARQAVSAQTFDIMFVDFYLPDGNAPEIIVSLQNEHPDIRFYIMTGADEEMVRKQAVKAGCRIEAVCSKDHLEDWVSKILPNP